MYETRQANRVLLTHASSPFRLAQRMHAEANGGPHGRGDTGRDEEGNQQEEDDESVGHHDASVVICRLGQ